jgi:hypothetical protein
LDGFQNQHLVDIICDLTIDASACNDRLMITKDLIRQEFASRLHLACNEAGVRARGRAVDIQNFLKKKSIDATTTAIGKWLNAEAVPEADKIRVIASWLRVRAEWLEYGVEPRYPTELPSNAEGSPSESRPRYQDEMYQKAAPSHRQTVDEIASHALGLSEDQAKALKDFMLRIAPHDKKEQ